MNGATATALRAIGAVRSPSGAGARASRSPWRQRLGLFAVLSAVLAANAVVLVTYNVFYDARFQALSRQREELEKTRDEARRAAERVQDTDRRLGKLKGSLETFYVDVLGARKEKLAPLIEDIHAITRKAGLVPASIAYREDSAPGAQRIALNFQIQGRYADVKKLLYAFESNPRFLVLEGVALTTDEVEPDVLKINLTVAHYFRGETPALKRPARSVARTPASPRPGPTPGPLE